MANFPGPWKCDSSGIAASDGTAILWANRSGEILAGVHARRLLLACPKMLDLLGRLDGLSETKAARLYMSSDHLRALGEIEDLLKEIDVSPAPQPGSVQFPLVEGSRFRFKTTTPPQKLLYGTLSNGPGLPRLIDTSRVEWHEITDPSQVTTAWIEVMEGGTEGKWARPRETVLDLQAAEGLDSPDRKWTVLKVESTRDRPHTSMTCLADGEDEFVVTAESSPVRCRFFLGEGRMGGRPLSSITRVPDRELDY